LNESEIKSDIEKLEENYIQKFKSSDRRYGYNIALGGKLNRHSEETKELISSIQIGKKLTKEHKEKISKSLIGRKCNFKKKLGKRIQGINIYTKKIIYFDSIADAVEKLNLPRAGISGSCSGRYSYVKDYIFKYLEDDTRDLLNDLKKIQVTNSKKIIGINIFTEEILEFNSSEEAAKKLNLGKNAGAKIRGCLSKKTNTAYDFN
jgi:hypothetical protein